MTQQTHRHPVHRVVTHTQALDAFRQARLGDVETGGVYDARSAAIIVWSAPWTTSEQEQASEVVGTIYLAWRTPDAAHATVLLLEVEAGGTVAEIQHHLTLLFGEPSGTP